MRCLFRRWSEVPVVNSMGRSQMNRVATEVTVGGLHDSVFSLRKDHNGYRPVFPLGNIFGSCPYDCTFCNVKATTAVSPEQAKGRFTALLSEYLGQIDGPYHPVIYNQGNVTSAREFPRRLLDEILEQFRSDERVLYVSLNSRERDATPRTLAYLERKELPFAIHFILGIESFSERTPTILGKDTSGELTRFVQKLRCYNTKASNVRKRRQYAFGLDVNLLFLPELYLAPYARRTGNVQTIRNGIEKDLICLLEGCVADVPVQINIHPYSRVESLPYEDANLALLVPLLPTLQQHIDRLNEARSRCPSHLFVGMEGNGYSSVFWEEQKRKWASVLSTFNETGQTVELPSLEEERGSSRRI